MRTFRLPARIGVFGEARITLQQALAMALANNKDIEASRIDREISGYTLTGARGLYDPTVGAVSQFLKQVNPVASSLGGSATGAVLNRTWQTDPTLSGSSPWLGGTYHVDLSSQRAYTNNTFVTLNPQYPSALNFQYTQPLWRNLRYDQNRHTIDVARKNRSLSDEQFRLRVMQVVEQTEQAYWEVFYAYNNLQVQLDSVDIARQQDESNRRQQAQGLLAPIDVVAAQTQLANFELNAYSAQSALTQAENNLKTLMLEGRSSALWASALVPVTAARWRASVDSPERCRQRGSGQPSRAQPGGNLRPDQRERHAPVSRPDQAAGGFGRQLHAQRSRGTGDHTERRESFHSQLRPSDRSPQLLCPQPRDSDPINLSSGNVNTAPALLVGDYGQSLSNLWAGNFPTTQVQLRVSLPIRNRAAEANLSTAVAQGRRIQNQREQVEQTIEADVRNAMQSMQSAELRLEAARIQRESAEEQYNSEQRQFRAGTSTLFLVQQRQTTMITARSQERRAESDLGEAVSAYELATGSILRQHNINLQ